RSPGVAVARRFGFQGALVPGIEVYAYMTHLPVARWGREWLERGTVQCRFAKPVYDGKAVTVSATESAGMLAIVAESGGERCASGTAALTESPLDPPFAADAPAWRRGANGESAIPEPDDRPDADEATLAAGRRLSSRAIDVTVERLRQYLADIGETEPLYAREG